MWKTFPKLFSKKIEQFRYKRAVVVNKHIHAEPLLEVILGCGERELGEISMSKVRPNEIELSIPYGDFKISIKIEGNIDRKQ